MRSIVFALALSACAGSAPTPKTPIAHSESGVSGDNIAAAPTIWVTPELGSPHAGDAAPDFELVDQDGKKQRLSSYRGRTVVLAFILGYCPFSRAEQPNLKKLAEDYAGKDVQVLGVLVKEEEADYASYMSRMPMPFPIMRDTTAQAQTSYTPPKAPVIKDGAPAIATSNLIIDPDGTIQFFTLLDMNHFDAQLVHLRAALDKIIAKKQG